MINRNETGSNLSLGTRLTVLSKRGRKRCFDATPKHFQEFCRLTIFASHYKKMLRLLPKIEGFGGIPGPEVYQMKNEYTQRRRLRRINSLLKVKLSRLECLYKPPEIRTEVRPKIFGRKFFTSAEIFFICGLWY